MAPDHGLARAVAVCPTIPYPPQNGGHKRTLRLLEAMARGGVAPHVLSADAGGELGAEGLRRRGWQVEVLPQPEPSVVQRLAQHANRRPSPYLRGVATRLRDLAREGIAFAQFEHTQSAYYFDELPGVQVALSLHNVDSRLQRDIARGYPRLSAMRVRSANRSRSMRALERRALPLASAVLCVSPEDARAARSFARQVLVVPNGVDDDLFEIAPEQPEDETLLFFGRLSYRPNAHGLLRFLREGWPVLAQARPAARLRIAGGGVNEEVVTAARAAERVEAVGLVDDIATELARASVVVAPIWHGGGTRLKVLEALGAARPVVGPALAVSGIGFEHGRHGLVVESPRELALAAASLLGDRARARSLGSAGRRHAEAFRWTRVTLPAEELYRSWAAPRTFVRSP